MSRSKRIDRGIRGPGVEREREREREREERRFFGVKLTAGTLPTANRERDSDIYFYI